MNLSDAIDNVVLRQIIRDRIAREGSSIDFATFMELALYEPQQGYYLTNDPTLDYQSSPNVHPLFGALVARQLAELWRLMGSPAAFQVFEAGAGSGRLASDILQNLRTAEPTFYASLRYVVQDRSLAAEGVASLGRVGLPLDKVEVASGLRQPGSVEGCILSNELLDALPVHRLVRRDGRLHELRVGLQEDRFVDIEADLSPELRDYFDWLGVQPAEGCQAEANLNAVAWTRQAAAALRRGYILTLDYGYDSAALYAPWRHRGTLLTFYRHTSDEDPYARLGRQDITASVDFTAVHRAGEEAGLRTLGLTGQAEFLASLGIGEALSRQPRAEELEAYYALRRAAIELTDPAGLGRISVLLQGRGVPDDIPAGFQGSV